MKRRLMVAAAALALTVAPAFADLRAHSGFRSVAASDRIEVEVSMGDEYRVEVVGADADRVRTRVVGDTLRISQADRSWFGGQSRRLDATVHVTMPEVEALSASRGAEVSGAGIRADDMAIAAAMGGEVRVSGECGALDAAVSMGGVVRAEEFECREADVAASMGGDARVHATGSYDAAASMGGAIRVSGGGQRDGVATSMGGEVREE